MARPQLRMDERTDRCRDSPNILNKQYRTVDKGWFSGYTFEREDKHFSSQNQLKVANVMHRLQPGQIHWNELSSVIGNRRAAAHCYATSGISSAANFYYKLYLNIGTFTAFDLLCVMLN
jgi:hypothetical protein